MSRIGKTPIKVLAGVKVDIKESTVKVEGPKGKLMMTLQQGVSVNLTDNYLHVSAHPELSERSNSLYGLTRTLLNNMVQGVHTGFTKELDIVGVGYRAAIKGTVLSMTLGFSHPVEFPLPTGITAKVENNTHIVLHGADKILVGMVAAQIRAIKEPEPYQGKGIRYTNERIIRKAGKAAGAK